MKQFLLIIALFLVSGLTFSQNSTMQQSNAQLASVYFYEKQYEKAAPLYLQLFETTKLSNYFDSYVNCLIGLKQYDEAEKVVKKQLKSSKLTTYHVTLGYIYKLSGDQKKSDSEYENAIDNLTENKGVISMIANAFMNYREFDYAEKVYIKGRDLVKDDDFRFNLANVYMYQRNYEKMLWEYLDLIQKDENYLGNIEARLSSALYLDVDNSMRNLYKRIILKRVQENPDVIVFNRLLVWLYIQENDFEKALSQTISIDRRTKIEDDKIFLFSQSAALTDSFRIALDGFDYLLKKQPKIIRFDEVLLEKLNTEYRRFIFDGINDSQKTERLNSIFDTTLTLVGKSSKSATAIKNFAHFLSFHMGKPDKAIDLLNNALVIRDLTRNQKAEMKTELGDVYVYNDQLWDATLLYAQVIEDNKDNLLGDDVKLKKAILGYYIGNFSWAQAQLDVIKASTSKLTANDAMELSILISSNFDQDTTEVPMKKFSQADLLLYRNKTKDAIITYDSILTEFKNTPLSEEILMRKAQIYERENKLDLALDFYTQIVDNYSFEPIADNALFSLATVYDKRLNNKEKAMEAYQKLMNNYPGSFYIAEARKRYRILRGDKIELYDETKSDSISTDGPSEIIFGR